MKKGSFEECCLCSLSNCYIKRISELWKIEWVDEWLYEWMKLGKIDDWGYDWVNWMKNEVLMMF